VKKKDCDVLSYNKKLYTGSGSSGGEEMLAAILDQDFNCTGCAPGFYCEEFGTQLPCPRFAWSCTLNPKT